MTRDHDMKRAIRTRMKDTGERYTVARSALVAPSSSSSPAPETALSQGETMASDQTDLLNELDERGFALVKSFAPPSEVATLTAVVDEIVAATIAQKLAEADERQAAGEPSNNIWYPGEDGVVFSRITERPEAEWIRKSQRLSRLVAATTGVESAVRDIAAYVVLPGCGHQGLHVESELPKASIGSWDRVRFVITLSSHSAETGTIRVVPGSHRTGAPFSDAFGAAMPPHPDEVRINAEPGDLVVYSPQLWMSGTFNGGVERLSSLLIS